MPKRTDIDSILIIGAGPIVIGQACEFDYSGTQACKALRAEGYRIVLVNSNPATIMTDPELADATYIEPITPEIVEKIIAGRNGRTPLLPTMGGQTALNTALDPRPASGVLAKYGVEMIGAKADGHRQGRGPPAVPRGDGPDRARDAALRCWPMTSIEALKALEFIGLPAIIRPSFTLGGTGGGIAYNLEEFCEIVERGLDASPTTEVLIEEACSAGRSTRWRSSATRADNCIIVCSIENIDPMGVHTGDSITVAPALTLTDKEYQRMRNASIAVLREIGVETGGSNVQFAVNPADGRLVVIEMNPRVSRSSALASKATGFPIAKVAARLAVGYTLDELDQRHHRRRHAGLVRADHRLRRHQDPALRLREISRRRAAPHHLDEVGGRGDGDRPHLPGIAAEGACAAWRPASPASTRSRSRASAQGDDENAIRAALARPTPDRLLQWPRRCGSASPSRRSTRLANTIPGSSRQIEGIVEMEEQVRSLRPARRCPEPARA